MRILLILCTTLFLGLNSLFAQSNVFINEISYKDIIASDRGVEIAGPAGTDLNGWYMEFRESNNTTYHTETVSGPTPIDNELSSGRGGIWIPVAGLQDNENRSIILFDNANTPRDTVSYGATAPILGSDYEIPTSALQIVGGTTPQNLGEDSGIAWWVLQPASKGDLNLGQLPVELISFKATLVKNASIMLTWVTASEMENSHFEIEKSINGMDYEKIGRVEGNGTTWEMQFYEFTDNSPQNGVNYYRLKQVDIGGTFEYSNIITYKQSENVKITVAPNPIQQNSELKIITADDSMFDIMIYDINGRIVKTIYKANQLTIDDLEEGLYIYHISQNGKIIKKDKLVIID